MANTEVKFRGSMIFNFLGQNYELMKPSLEDDVYVMLQGYKSDSVDTVALDDKDNCDQIEKLLEGGDEFEKPNDVAIADWLESFKVTDLAFAREPNPDAATTGESKYAFLLKVGVEIVFAGKGLGFDPWFTVQSVRFTVSKQFSKDDRLKKNLRTIDTMVFDAMENYRAEISKELELKQQIYEIRLEADKLLIDARANLEKTLVNPKRVETTVTPTPQPDAILTDREEEDL